MDNIFYQRVEALRALMRENHWDIVIINGSDPHASEYPANRWKQVEWLSGFTGEAGDIVVTENHAGLWTDTRYFIQANKQLAGTGIVLHKMRVPEQVPIPQWIASLGMDEPCIAIDGLCETMDSVRELRESVPGAVIFQAFLAAQMAGDAEGRCHPPVGPGRYCLDAERPRVGRGI